MLKDYIVYDVRLYLISLLLNQQNERKQWNLFHRSGKKKEYMEAVEMKKDFGQLTHNLELTTFRRRKNLMRCSFIITECFFVLLRLYENIVRHFYSHFVSAERIKLQFTFPFQHTEYRKAVSLKLEL
jgi:hypothetical protein